MKLGRQPVSSMIQWFCATSFSLKYQKLFCISCKQASFLQLASKRAFIITMAGGKSSAGPFSSYRVTGNGVTPSLEDEPRRSDWDPWLESPSCHLPGSRHDPQPWLTRRQDATRCDKFQAVKIELICTWSECWLLLNHCFVFGQVHKWDFEDLEILCCLASTHSLSPFAGTEAGGLLGTGCLTSPVGTWKWTLDPARMQLCHQCCFFGNSWIWLTDWTTLPLHTLSFKIGFQESHTCISNYVNVCMYCAQIYAHVYNINNP